MTDTPVPDDVLASTRDAMQRLAEHVLSKARHDATGRIGLRATPGGIGTPPFPSPASGGAERQVRIEGTEVVVTDGATEQRAPITTVRAAAELVGVEPGAPAGVYTPHTPLEPDAPLAIDAAAVAVIAAWYALADEALESLRAEHADGDTEVSAVQLWPEHFDLACSIGEVNYGASPGDDAIPRPYLYVGPWSPPTPDGDFWTEPFGSARTQDTITSPTDALAYYRDGLTRASAL